MDTIFRNKQGSNLELHNFFLTPTNYTFPDFVKSFGIEIASEVYHSLYQSSNKQKTYRQLIPVLCKMDNNTTKYAFQLHDGRQIETVVIKRRTGKTICRKG